MNTLLEVLQGFFNGCSLFSIGFLLMAVVHFFDVLEKKMSINNIHGYAIVIALVIGLGSIIGWDSLFPESGVARISSIIFMILAAIALFCIFAATSSRDE